MDEGYQANVDKRKQEWICDEVDYEHHKGKRVALYNNKKHN